MLTHLAVVINHDYLSSISSLLEMNLSHIKQPIAVPKGQQQNVTEENFQLI